MPKRKGIAQRLDQFLETCQDEKVRTFLSAFIDYGVKKLNFDRDFWVYELVNGIIGDHYPFPDRSLIHIEKVVRDYLLQELCQGVEIEGQFNIFSVEGGAAGMCYLFDSLVHNHLLHKGDKIALIGNEIAVTTLFKILAGEMEADSGEFKWGITITNAYFPKDNSQYFNDCTYH